MGGELRRVKQGEETGRCGLRDEESTSRQRQECIPQGREAMKVVRSLSLPAELDQRIVRGILNKKMQLAVGVCLGYRPSVYRTRVKSCWVRGERVMISTVQETKQGAKGSCPIRLICTGLNPRRQKKTYPNPHA